MKNKILFAIAIMFTVAYGVCSVFGIHFDSPIAEFVGFGNSSGVMYASLTTLCAKIDADILINCTNPIQAGTKDEFIIFNFDDFEGAILTRNGTNTQIIENIILPSGVVGFVVQGINNSNAPKNMFNKGKFLGSFDHEINFKAFDLSPAVKDQIEKMAKGRFVAIVQNNYKGANGNAAYEIYGLDAGMILSIADRDPANQDTQGAYDITLKSSDVSKEAHLPASIFKTDYATTKVIVESLV